MIAPILLLQAGGDGYQIGSARTELFLYLKLMVVLGVIIAAAFMLVHFALPRLAAGRTPGACAIRVAARLTLEPKKTLYVVRVGAEYFLVGASESGMQYLTTLDPERIEAALKAGAPPEREFPAVMQAFRRRKGPS
jgi:flagellar biogenesis protein FliO